MTRLAAIFGILAALGVGYFALGTGHKAEGPAMSGGAPGGTEGVPKGPPPVPVVATPVEKRAMRQLLEVTGELKTDEDVKIGSRIAGKIARVTVKEGDRVRTGQVLVQLDDRELRAQIAGARGRLASARAKLSLARNESVSMDAGAQSDYEKAKADVRAAEARLRQAETNAGLVEVQVQTAIQAGQSAVNVATERLSIARETTRKQELRQAQLAVDRADAQVAQAKVDRDSARRMLDRRQKLLKQDAIAKEDFDEAERRFRTADAEVKVTGASAAVARQKLDLAREGVRAEEVRAAEEALRAAYDELARARSDERKNQVARDNVTAAKAALEQAKAQERSAEAGLAQTRISVDEIRSAGAAVEQARADIAVYETQLRDLTIAAPVAGVVSTRSVNEGEAVNPGTGLMNLVALDTVYLEAQVPEMEVSLVRPGAAGKVTIDALPGRTLQGTVREVIPVAERSSKIFRVRIAVAGAGDRLPAGSHARAVLAVGRRPDAIAVRKEAVLTESGDRYVWIVAPGADGKATAKRQVVTVGLVDDRYAEITAGLKAGQQVILSGSPAIIDGTPLGVR